MSIPSNDVTDRNLVEPVVLVDERPDFISEAFGQACHHVLLKGRSERVNDPFIIEESSSMGQFFSMNGLFDRASVILTVNRNTAMVKPLR